MEEWCDCNPACGTSGTDEYYLKTYRSLNIGRAFVIHYDFKPVEDTIARATAIMSKHNIDFIFYTECGGIPSAQVHSLWPIAAAMGIPVVAIWHDSQGGIVRDLEGVACNVVVDTRTLAPQLRNLLTLWVPHHTDLFYDDGRERPHDVVHPSSRNSKSIAADYFGFIQGNGINCNWRGGQREDRLSWFEYAEQFRHGKICLNFPRNSPERTPQVKSRVTEALYSGCALFEHGNDHMTDMLVDGREYVAFHNKDDLLEKIRYYLGHPDELNKIALAGGDRARKDYSPWRWWNAIFKFIGRENGITGMYD